MSKFTISTFQLFQMFPDERSARVYLEGRLWPKGTCCPTCSGQDRITARKREGFYRCNKCQIDFTVRTGTIFERSHIPLHKWIYAMYLLITTCKDISSMQLAKEIGVTQKTAWFMLSRIGKASMHKSGKRNRPSGIVSKSLENMVDLLLAHKPCRSQAKLLIINDLSKLTPKTKGLGLVSC